MWEIFVTKFRKVASCAFAWYFCDGFVFFSLGKAPQCEPFKTTILNPNAPRQCSAKADLSRHFLSLELCVEGPNPRS